MLGGGGLHDGWCFDGGGGDENRREGEEEKEEKGRRESSVLNVLYVTGEGSEDEMRMMMMVLW